MVVGGPGVHTFRAARLVDLVSGPEGESVTNLPQIMVAMSVKDHGGIEKIAIMDLVQLQLQLQRQRQRQLQLQLQVKQVGNAYICQLSEQLKF